MGSTSASVSPLSTLQASCQSRLMQPSSSSGSSSANRLSTFMQHQQNIQNPSNNPLTGIHVAPPKTVFGQAASGQSFQISCTHQASSTQSRQQAHQATVNNEDENGDNDQHKRQQQQTRAIQQAQQVGQMHHQININLNHNNNNKNPVSSPSANTSGLPVPMVATNRCKQPTQLASISSYGSTNLPSTVGSALRSRQPAHSPNASSRHQPPGLQTANIYGLRRSQSQRPPSYSQSNSFMSPIERKQQIELPVFARGRNEDYDDDDGDDSSPTACIELPPPLKSSSYISRLASNSPSGAKLMDRPENCNGQPASEPTSLTARLPSNKFAQRSLQPTQNKPATSKPSQLVKPLVNQQQQQTPLRDGSTSKPNSGLSGGAMRRSLSSSKQLNGSIQSVASSSSTEASRLPLTKHKSSLVKRSSFVPALATSSQHRISSQTFGTSNSQASIPRTKDHSTAIPSISRSRLEPARAADAGGTTLASKKSSLPAKPAATVSKSNRRMSLQQSGGGGGLNSSLKLHNESADNQSTSSPSGSSLGDEDDNDEPEEFDDDDDEEEDATTATTMTQISDSNELADASRELNSMIKMLTSKEIMRESESRRGPSDNDPNSGQSEPNGIRDPAERGPAKDPRSRGRHRMIDGVGVVQANTALSSSFECGNKPKSPTIVKSQSLSFNRVLGENEKQQQQSATNITTTTTGQTSGETRGSFTATTRSRAMQTRSLAGTRCSQRKTIPLPRPRSRIIFDPTSSQFHVSQRANDDLIGDEGVIGDDDNDDSSSSSASFEDVEEACRTSFDHGSNENENTSRKLINAQNRLARLKCLSNDDDDDDDDEGEDGNDNGTTNDWGASSQMNDLGSIRRLKLCQGSLESLMSNRRSSTGETDQANINGCTTTTSLARPNDDNEHQQQQLGPHRRSPVGQAIRSLFGLGSPANQQQSAQTATGPDCGPASRIGLGSSRIVRHASLRADPRGAAAASKERGRKTSVTEPQTNHQDPSQNQSKSNQAGEPAAEQQQSLSLQANTQSRGSDLLQRASKRLSASSSSLTSKFKHMITAGSAQSSSSSSSSTTTTTNCNGQQVAKRQANTGGPPIQPPDGGPHQELKVSENYNGQV